MVTRIHYGYCTNLEKIWPAESCIKDVALNIIPNCVMPYYYFSRPSYPQINSLCWPSYVVKYKYFGTFILTTCNRRISTKFCFRWKMFSSCSEDSINLTLVFSSTKTTRGGGEIFLNLFLFCHFALPQVCSIFCVKFYICGSLSSEYNQIVPVSLSYLFQQSEKMVYPSLFLSFRNKCP